MASLILGEWTHRRGDKGGTRAVAAEIDKPRPAIAWSWRPEHGGRVDQVRLVGQNVIVATMPPRDTAAPGWEHAILYALDARSGVEIARRVLPDPVPVAAIVVDSGMVHAISTRKGEPVFWYALNATDLAARHRRTIALPSGIQHDDVLDAWSAPEAGLWLELDASVVSQTRALVYVFAEASGHASELSFAQGNLASDGAAAPRDACAGGHELFAPLDGRWTSADPPLPPVLARLQPRVTSEWREPWARATVVGPRAQIHAVGSDGIVCAVAAAEDPDKPERARVEMFAVDRSSGAVRWRAQGDRVAIKAQLGDVARVARRPNGELLFQSLGLDGAPRTPLVCARPDGRFDEILLGARGRWVLDAALGDLVLAHRENAEGMVQVGGIEIDHEGRLLGRRAIARWTIDAGDLGGGTTVYAGAGAVVVRGARGLSAVQL